MKDSIWIGVLGGLLGAGALASPLLAQDVSENGARVVSPIDVIGGEDEREMATAADSADSAAATSVAARAEGPPPAQAEPVPAPAPGASAPAPAATEECEQEPVFDPSTPRFELQVGGGYAALFHTWRQTADGFMNPGRHQDGLYHGPLFRGELAFAFGGLSLSAIYTHLFLSHDGMPDNVQMGLVSGEIGVQCACRGSQYVWSFGVEVGGDVLNASSTTIFLSIEHRSMFYVYEGLFLGFDVDFATFIGLTSNGASGGGILGSLFLGYSIG